MPRIRKERERERQFACTRQSKTWKTAPIFLMKKNHQLQNGQIQLKILLEIFTFVPCISFKGSLAILSVCLCLLKTLGFLCCVFFFARRGRMYLGNLCWSFILHVSFAMLLCYCAWFMFVFMYGLCVDLFVFVSFWHLASLSWFWLFLLLSYWFCAVYMFDVSSMDSFMFASTIYDFDFSSLFFRSRL